MNINYQKYLMQDDTCYIYSILNKENIDTKYKKDISRKLYKLNKDIVKDDINMYMENITDVSVSSVLSLYIFIKLIKDKVSTIKGVPYLPMRYMSRDIAATNSNRKDLMERNDMIQTNLTDKFIRTFRRVEKYFPDIEITSYPYEIDEYITIKKCMEKDYVSNQVTEALR